MRLIISIILWFFNFSLYANQLTDDQIKDYLINQSISQYSGNCPCPYSKDKIGHECGNRSAWSKKGGYAPLCYPADITQEMILEYQHRMSQDSVPFTRQGCSGCCSHHGGIQGCDNTTGKIICNDGSPSPSCSCDCLSSSYSNQQGSSVNENNQLSCVCPLDNDEFGNLCGRRSVYSISPIKYMSTCYPNANSSFFSG